MITFSNWTIRADRRILARQYDDRTASLTVTGDLPDGWAWEMLVSAGGGLDVIALSLAEDGVSFLLTADHLSVSGLYTLQLRGRKGEEIRHTNLIQLLVPESLSGDAAWPSLPTEFTQAEQRIAAYNAHPPVPGADGFWLIWDVDKNAYLPSQFPMPGSSFPFRLGNSLKVTGENVLEVNCADDVEQDNTLPITSAAVHTTVGNIDAVLKTI